MKQLILNWRNDGIAPQQPCFPEGVELKTFPQLQNGEKAWLDIVRYMYPGEQEITEKGFYDRVMIARPYYDEKMCYFLMVNGEPAATITVICDYGAKNGYIHMVSCKPQFRGKGLGTLMNVIAVDVLKTAGMQTAYLTTDDWRIPAIKSYLKAGFLPDLESEPDYKERWNKIYDIIRG